MILLLVIYRIPVMFQCSDHLTENGLYDLASLMTHSRTTAIRHYAVRQTDRGTARGHRALREGLEAAVATATTSRPPTPSRSPDHQQAIEDSPADEGAEGFNISPRDSQPSTRESGISCTLNSRLSGQYSIFSKPDHSYLGNMWSALLERDVGLERKATNQEVNKHIEDDSRSDYLATQYTRHQLLEKYKSLFKNLLKRKREKKPLVFVF